MEETKDMTRHTEQDDHLGLEALDRLLTGEGRTEWHAHMEHCGSCRQELRELRTLVTALEALPHHVPSAGFTDRVMARVRLPAVRRVRRGVLDWLRWGTAPAAATTAVAAAGGWLWILSRPEVSLRALAGLAFEAVQRLLVAGAIEVGEFVVASGLAPSVLQILTDISTTGALGALGAFAMVGLTVTVLAVASLQRTRPAWQMTRRA